MVGIYLTEEAKKAIEDKIAELEKELLNDPNPFTSTHTTSRATVYKEILSLAMMLMKGIHLSEEGKKAIEDTLTEFHSQWIKNEQTWGKIFTLKETLSLAMILPVEDNHEKFQIRKN